MNETSVPAAGDVSPQEVADFLQEKMPDLQAGVELKLPGTAPAVKPESPPPLAPDPAFAPGTATTGKALETILPTGDLEFTAADIALTDAEKETFLTAVLTDTTVELTLELPGLTQAPAVIRSRNNAEQALLFGVLELDQQEKRIVNTMAYLTWLQYYDAALRLLKFGRQTYPGVNFGVGTTAEQAAPVLRAAVEKHFLPMSSLKWKLVASAIRLFDLKLNAAANAMVQRNFSPPAG
ncbi:MAG TPA: hypothetical protein VLH09_06985 [Bryobacteraceae bacterium]|nr:hypothetical protein [Bryobacteraceae bacterium]